MKSIILFPFVFLFLATIVFAVGEGTYGSGTYGSFSYGIAQSATIVDEEQEIIGDNITEVIVPIGSPIQEIIVNSTNDDEDVNVSLANLINETGDVELINNFTLTRQTETVNYVAEILAGTIISGGADWDGKINVPTIRDATSYSISSGTTDVVIDVGSEIEINFSKAVKIIIGGQAGKNAAWSRGTNTLTEITTICDNVTNPTNINTNSPRECYIDLNNDLLIWSYHFTQFAAYTETATPATPTPLSAGGGRGSPAINVADLEEETPTEEAIPPTEVVSVVEQPTTPTETPTEEPTTETEGGLAAITGAVIGRLFGSTSSTITTLIIVAALVMASVFVFNPRQRRRLMRKFRRRDF